MQRSAIKNLLQPNVLSYTRQKLILNQIHRPPPYDVFINHRGIDTKMNFASLLHDHLERLWVRPFLDKKSLKPGDKLFETIRDAIEGCKIGVAVFSPRYCESYYCLLELALIVESKKKMIPIFCDVKPSQLRVSDDGIYTASDFGRFYGALEEAKHTGGLAFDTQKGNWSDVVTRAADMVMDSLREVEDEPKKGKILRLDSNL